MHTVSPRLIWAQLIPASDSGGPLQDTKCCSAEELIDRIQRTETLTEVQYGNVYTCFKPCNRNPALHNQCLSGSLI